ncbi:hypothetical protein GLAREA_11190 [Glarea lozoyensis ATCC 20868]|uniref:Autophagy-related protein 33 n=1 Tax=Glarea lozoyensis (strain ATCC 20868 / MF5171) TaxID=1116229 RepID=S3DU61_GLAL2|nr:uncharacterized protein GLAREA_11190 [Glarea lozoyensis ATCC 20868]EPE35491.1 hypothetical protein GLAREA_11190 [Glarea lozoyensis ATCC 20868]
MNSTFKFIGVTSLGLYTGLSYTLSALTLPTLLTLPSATSASRATALLTHTSLLHLRSLAGISLSSFLLSYLLSPRNAKHPYLLWTSLLVASSSVSELLLAPTKYTAARNVKGKGKAKAKRQMDSSYEVLGASDQSEEEVEEVEEVNGEEVRERITGFMKSQVLRTAISAVGFAVSVVGIWGDGVNRVVYVEV